MEKIVHNEPTQEEIYAFHMQVTHTEMYTFYKIHLPNTTEGQKKRLSARFNIPLRILEDEQLLTLKKINDL